MPSSPLGKKNGRTTLGVAYHLFPYTAHMVGRHRAWHDIITLGKQTRSDNVECMQACHARRHPIMCGVNER